MSLDQRLRQIIEPHMIDGQSSLAQHIKTLVYKKAPQWFDLLDYEDDLIFLEPALFAWFTDPSPNTPLSQQLIGLVNADTTRTAEARSDEDGVIFVPRAGILRVKEANTTGTLILEGREWLWHPDGKDKDLCYPPIQETLTHIAPNVTLGQGKPPAVAARFFANGTVDVGGFSVNDLKQHQNVKRALELISQQDATLHEWICFCTRYIHLYQADLTNSFGSLSVHGAAFLNVPDDANVIFYLDDLAHQCGHVIFNSATLQKNAFLACAPDTPLKSLTTGLNDPRSVYSAFHGLFTYTSILRSLSRNLDQMSTNDDHLHVLARIAFYLRKFQHDLKNLNSEYIYAPLGKKLYEIFFSYYEFFRDEFADQIITFDLSNQPYAFSWRRFFVANFAGGH